MIGLCCQYLDSFKNKKGNNIYYNALEERNLQYGKFLKQAYSNSQIEEVWINNATNLLNILKRIHKEGFRVFRVSSNLFPLHDSVTDMLHQSQSICNILKEIGNFVKNNNMRLTTHPDQFVVISSNNPNVIEKSVMLLKHHAWIFDTMDVSCTPYNAINIHGGTKGNSKILIDTIKNLPLNIKNRLTLENDERSYNVQDLHHVYQETGIPICWDSHHHTFNDAKMNLPDALILAKSTWHNVKPLTHLSNTDPLLKEGSFLERRKHSDYVHYIPECQLNDNNNNEIDIEFEFKMKNIAINKAINEFNIQLS